MSHSAGTSSSSSRPALNTTSVYPYHSPHSPHSPQTPRSPQPSGIPPVPRRQTTSVQTSPESTISAAGAFRESMAASYRSLERPLTQGSSASSRSSSIQSDDMIDVPRHYEGQTQGSGIGRMPSLQTLGDDSPVGVLRNQVFEKFRQLQGGVEAGFSAVDKRFEVVNQQFGVVNERFDEIDRRFNTMDHKIDNMKTDLEKSLNMTIDKKMEAVTVQLQSLIIQQMQILQQNLIEQLKQNAQLTQIQPVVFEPPALPRSRISGDSGEIRFARPTREESPTGPPARPHQDVTAQPTHDPAFLEAVEAADEHMQAVQAEASSARSIIRGLRHTFSTRTSARRRAPPISDHFRLPAFISVCDL
ncbi:hypothetical protein CERSUDRAFT_119043 [Gelatoporia subvermispora B]|uniref:Uncharacterized protein n=1 Tax=Ceriporiopsis subvermispora (strain B) TaxID=914234 RepID=M2Q5F5_CERS8|nr:hypothetical protein CERSUDRAFT_119043 [Gelatoporia subvermispora B]